MSFSENSALFHRPRPHLTSCPEDQNICLVELGRAQELVEVSFQAVNVRSEKDLYGLLSLHVRALHR